MTSNDNQQYITVEIYNAGNERLEKQIISLGEKQDNLFKELKSEIQSVKDIALVNSTKIDAYRDFTSIGFTVITIAVAIVGLGLTLAPMFREMYKDAKKSNLKNEIREVMNEEIDAAVKRALSLK